MKSKTVQKLEKYLVKPKASHFNNISTINMIQKTKFVQYKTVFNLIFFSKWISSKHSVTLEANIKIRTNHSNAGVSTTDKTDVLMAVHFRPNFVSAKVIQHGHLRKISFL